MRLSGWGRYPKRHCTVSAPRTEAELRSLVAEGRAIARGNGRAYGDAAMSVANTIDMRQFRHMISFDTETGVLVAEAGVLLADIIHAFLPRGWFPMVTPGTKFVTLGGMIAADVHGKNHHKDGSFAACIEWIDIMDEAGEVRRCGPGSNDELFGWTVGGMGLTGAILRAAIRLTPVETGWIRQETIAAPSLDAAMEIFDARDEVTYSVAWIDCLATGESLGRSLVMLGEHARLKDIPEDSHRMPYATKRRRKLAVPMDAPAFALNGWTVRAFNTVYWRAGLAKEGMSLVDWDSYFYPLDAILGWNRIYGRRGFLQFQCALPEESSREGLRRLLREISRAGQGSFLSVLKKLGPQDSRFSFPMAGYTLALDFPASKKCLDLMEELDRITIDHGGRFYLAKDARMSAETLRKSDARTEQFAEMRAATGAQKTFASAQSERLNL